MKRLVPQNGLPQHVQTTKDEKIEAMSIHKRVLTFKTQAQDMLEMAKQEDAKLLQVIERQARDHNVSKEQYNYNLDTNDFDLKGAAPILGKGNGLPAENEQPTPTPTPAKGKAQEKVQPN